MQNIAHWTPGLLSWTSLMGSLQSSSAYLSSWARLVGSSPELLSWVPLLCSSPGLLSWAPLLGSCPGLLGWLLDLLLSLLELGSADGISRKTW